MTDVPQINLAEMAKPISESAKYLKMLIYGEAKVGKTTFAGTAPSPLFLKVEPGAIVLVKNEENRERFKDTLTVDLNNIGMLNAITKALREGQMPDRKTVVLDSLTEFEKRVLSQWTRYAMNKGISKNDNEFSPEWPEYKSTTSILRKAMWEFRDLERHVIVLCHNRDDEDKKKGGMKVNRPALMPALGSTLTAMFNVIGYMYVENEVHKMRVVPTLTTVAGNHIWDGPPVIDNPTFDMFMLERALQNDVRS